MPEWRTWKEKNYKRTLKENQFSIKEVPSLIYKSLKINLWISNFNKLNYNKRVENKKGKAFNDDDEDEEDYNRF